MLKTTSSTQISAATAQAASMVVTHLPTSHGCVQRQGAPCTQKFASFSIKLGIFVTRWCTGWCKLWYSPLNYC